MESRRIVGALLVVGMLLGGARAVVAGGPAGPDAPEWDVTPPRVSYLGGEISFWRPGADAWAPARLNTPLAPGDFLYVGAGGTMELQIGPRAFVRAAADTQLGLESQEPDFVQFRIMAGHAALDLRDLPPGHTVTLGTPNAALTVEHAGYYRISVGPDTTIVDASRGGRATLTLAGGGAVPIASGQQMVLTGADSPDLTASAAPDLSAWDRWNHARTDSLIAAASPRYVPPGVYGAEALGQHGIWRVVEPYGPVWIPAAVPAGWVPYTTGRWIWDPRYGWTWLDDAPWGWAPFHYGRWVFVSGSWAWAPGPVVVRPVYAPALVGFLGSPVVVHRPLCWVALGWGEPVIPWWGQPGFVGRPWWGGWGGPRVINNVVINRTAVVNVRDITAYRNVSVRNAVVAIPAERFGRAHVATARIANVDVPRLTPVHEPLAVKPVVASFVLATGPAPKPPDTIQKRVVLAPRPPRRAEATQPAAAPAVSPEGPERHLPRAPQAAKPPEPADRQSPRAPGVVKPTTLAKPSVAPMGPPVRQAETPERQRPAAPLRVEAPTPPEPARLERPSRPDRIKPPAPPSEGGRREPMVSTLDPMSPAPPSPARRPGPLAAQSKAISPVPAAIQGPAALPLPAARAARADDGPRKPRGELVSYPSGRPDVRSQRMDDQDGAGRKVGIARTGGASESSSRGRAARPASTGHGRGESRAGAEDDR